jgi:glyoxylase-like metal-dependent hydrolase (beta-lactamase superfamily II)
MSRWRYEKGLHDLGNGCWAWLAPDGSWGWSNAGLIRDGEASLLVDTLFDLKLTREMLDAMKPVTSGAPIRTLVNTHANGDHCWGNELVVDAEIIASKACAEELGGLQPSAIAAMLKADGLGDAGEFLRRIFGSFDFEGITVTPPTKTFEGELTVHVGSREVRLIEVGPAHTRGDVLVHVPADRTVFTGDILFIGGTPIVWEGPFANWIGACDRILDMDVETIVPGHGPITDKNGARDVKRYLEFVYREASERHKAGLSVEDAARDIALGEFAQWTDRERIAVNVQTVYRELGADVRADTVALFTLMSQLAN